MTSGAEENRTEEYWSLALAALQSLPIAAVTVFDADLRYVLVAGGAMSQAGFEAAAMEGQLVADVLSPERWAFWEPHYRAALRGETNSVEVQVVNGSGWYRVHVGPWRDANGVVAGGLTTARDVTDRKRAQDRAEGLFEAAPDAIVGKTVDGVIVSWNPGAVRVLSGERVDQLETVRRRKDGSLVDVSLTISAMRDASGGAIGVTTTARDITHPHHRHDRPHDGGRPPKCLDAGMDDYIAKPLRLDNVAKACDCLAELDGPQRAET